MNLNEDFFRNGSASMFSSNKRVSTLPLENHLLCVKEKLLGALSIYSHSKLKVFELIDRAFVKINSFTALFKSLLISDGTFSRLVLGECFSTSSLLQGPLGGGEVLIRCIFCDC